MDIYRINTPAELIKGNPYVGRGIIAGCSPEGKAVSAYFIMGRSANSRNRIFALKDGELFTEPFDASKVEDPSLIIYAALRSYENKLIVTNGDQTDTIVDGLKEGKSFSQALSSRQFEPDAPNLTPRISAMLSFEKGSFSYQMSILKSVDGQGSACCRYTFDYPALPGLGPRPGTLRLRSPQPGLLPEQSEHIDRALPRLLAHVQRPAHSCPQAHPGSRGHEGAPSHTHKG